MIDEKRIVDAYVHKHLSEMQIASNFSISPNRVRLILNAHKVPRRNRSEAIYYLNITKFAKKPYVLKKKLSIKDQKLKTAGIMLYWGEGTKKGSVVAFSNSDERMIRVFLHFLRIICGIHESRIRITIHYYADHNIKTLRSFWSQVTHVPEKQFYKPFLHVTTARGSYRTKSVHGTISIQYADKKLLKQIVDWMHEYGNILASLH